MYIILNYIYIYIYVCFLLVLLWKNQIVPNEIVVTVGWFMMYCKDKNNQLFKNVCSILMTNVLFLLPA